MAVPLPRWTRSVRRRPAAFVAILLLSAGAAVTCAATPGLIQAVDGATVRDAAENGREPGRPARIRRPDRPGGRSWGLP